MKEPNTTRSHTSKPCVALIWGWGSMAGCSIGLYDYMPDSTHCAVLLRMQANAARGDNLLTELTYIQVRHLESTAAPTLLLRHSQSTCFRGTAAAVMSLHSDGQDPTKPRAKLLGRCWQTWPKTPRSSTQGAEAELTNLQTCEQRLPTRSYCELRRPRVP